MKQLIETVEELRLKGIGFRSLTEALDTTTAQGRLVFHMFGALAEFERSLIRERIQAALATRSGSQPPSTPRHQALAAATASISISNSGATSALTMIVAEPGRPSPQCFARAAPAAATSSGRTK